MPSSSTAPQAEVDSRQSSGRPRAPSTAIATPIAFCGCKIYTSAAKQCWRVYPYPGQSVYDKSFSWKGGQSPEAVWERVMAYCDNPSLPDSRKSDIAA